jgi:hypothetical protein
MHPIDWAMNRQTLKTLDTRTASSGWTRRCEAEPQASGSRSVLSAIVARVDARGDRREAGRFVDGFCGDRLEAVGLARGMEGILPNRHRFAL